MLSAGAGCLPRAQGQADAAAPRQGTAQSAAATAAAAELRRGRQMLQEKRFAEAKRLFAEDVKTGVGGVQAQLGLGDAELGLHQFEAAETTYRAVVARQPELWQAHKNLVVVEAALGRWEDFDGERKILSLARERGAPGISAHESDVIDTFDVNGGHWIVRAYFEPVGRSRTVYNFERFSPAGRVEAYISLEDAAAAQAALTPRDEQVGAPSATAAAPAREYALNWYTGSAHGTLHRYRGGEPSYERVRSEVMQWLRSDPAPMRVAAP